MTYEIWHLIFIISLIISAVSALITVFLIIRYRIPAFIVSKLRKPEKFPESFNVKNEHITESASENPAKTEELIHVFSDENFTGRNGTVIAPHRKKETAENISSPEFIIKHIIIHADPDDIDNVVSVNSGTTLL